MQQPPVSLKKNLVVIFAALAVILVVLIVGLLGRGAQPSLPAATADPAPDTEGKKDAKAFLFISVKGRLYAIEPLDEERDVTIAQETGETNVIHLTPEGFRMHSSTCDNQLCIGQGEVTVENYTRRILGPYVLCLPNQVELQLVVPGATAAPDTPDI